MTSLQILLKEVNDEISVEPSTPSRVKDHLLAGWRASLTDQLSSQLRLRVKREALRLEDARTAAPTQDEWWDTIRKTALILASSWITGRPLLRVPNEPSSKLGTVLTFIDIGQKMSLVKDWASRFSRSDINWKTRDEMSCLRNDLEKLREDVHAKETAFLEETYNLGRLTPNKRFIDVLRL